MLAAIRTTLSVFSSPDKERWPTCRLLDLLKGAEDLAREMLREIASKITILPGKAYERAGQAPVPPQPPNDHAPYFRLGVAREDAPIGVWVGEDSEESSLSREGGEHEQGEGADAPSQTQSGEETASSTLEARLQALGDVLAHPGKHAARMARALYRAEHEAGGRLLAKCPDEAMLDAMNQMIGAFQRKDGAEFDALYGNLPKYEPG